MRGCSSEGGGRRPDIASIGAAEGKGGVLDRWLVSTKRVDITAESLTLCTIITNEDSGSRLDRGWWWERSRVKAMSTAHVRFGFNAISVPHRNRSKQLP